jgi:hypothetical protein
MVSKYIFRTILSLSVLSIVLFASCLGGAEVPGVEPSSDAQIYAFSIEARADTARLLQETAFTIDQVNGRLFNREFLPYRFSVDSARLHIGGVAGWGLSEVRVHLADPDTVFTLTRPADSIAINRLVRIETVAADRETRKTYDFQLNTFQQDPFIISWVRKSDAYIASTVEAQKTIVLNNLFITYYKANNEIRAVTSSATEGSGWANATLTGLPATAQLSSIATVADAAYILDGTNVYKTTDGINWSAVSVPHSDAVVVIYGFLPTSATEGIILMIIDDGGTWKFAETTDFSTINPLNNVPTGVADQIPVSGFSSAVIDIPAVYGVRYIVLSGGTRGNGFLNEDEVWLIEKAEGEVRTLSERVTIGGVLMQGSTPFFYDNRLYMLTSIRDGDNVLLHSERGVGWTWAGEDQQFPFAQRTHASVITDADNFIWIFGGRTPAGEFTDTWRGRLNRLEEEL